MGAKRSKGGEPDNMPRLATKRGREKFEKSRVGATRRDEKAERGKEESGVKREHRGKRDEKGKTITN